MSEKTEIPVDQLKQVNLKPTETVEKQVLPSAEGKPTKLMTKQLLKLFRCKP